MQNDYFLWKKITIWVPVINALNGTREKNSNITHASRGVKMVRRERGQRKTPGHDVRVFPGVALARSLSGGINTDLLSIQYNIGIILFFLFFLYSRRRALWSTARPGRGTAWTPSRTAAPPGPWSRPRSVAPHTGRTASLRAASRAGWVARTYGSSTAPRTWPARPMTTGTCSRPCTGNSRWSRWPKTASPAGPAAPPATRRRTKNNHLWDWSTVQSVHAYFVGITGWARREPQNINHIILYFIYYKIVGMMCLFLTKTFVLSVRIHFGCKE